MQKMNVLDQFFFFFFEDNDLNYLKEFYSINTENYRLLSMVYTGRKQEERVYINQGGLNRKACTYGINKKFASLLSTVYS